MVRCPPWLKHLRQNPWLALVAGLFLESCSGASYNFSLYSTRIKHSLGYSQSMLNTLGTAKDVNLGLLAGWLYGIIRPRTLLLIGAICATSGYLSVWLAVTHTIAQPPFVAMCGFLCIAANSGFFFTTGIIVTTIRNFPSSRGYVVGLMKGFSGLSAAIFSQIYTAIYAPDADGFLLLVAALPSVATLCLMFFIRPINRRQRGDEYEEYVRRKFGFLFAVGIILAVYLMAVILAEELVHLPKDARLMVLVAMAVILLTMVGVTKRWRKPAIISYGPPELPSTLESPLLVEESNVTSRTDDRHSHEDVKNIEEEEEEEEEGVEDTESCIYQTEFGLANEWMIEEEEEDDDDDDDDAEDAVAEDLTLGYVVERTTMTTAEVERLSVRHSHGDGDGDGNGIRRETTTRSQDRNHTINPDLQQPLQRILTGDGGGVPGRSGDGGDVIEAQTWKKRPERGEDFSSMEAWMTVDLWLIFISLIIGMGTGLTVVNNLSQIGSALGYEAKSISAFVSLLSIWNFLGCLGAGFGSEAMVRDLGWPRPVIQLVMQAVMATGHILFATGKPGSFYFGSAVIGLSYGAQASVMPAIVSEIFGLKKLAELYNWMCIASPIGSYLFSVCLAGHVYDREAAKQESSHCKGVQCYRLTFIIMAAFCVLGVLLNTALVLRTKKFYSEQCRAKSGGKITRAAKEESHVEVDADRFLREKWKAKWGARMRGVIGGGRGGGGR